MNPKIKKILTIGGVVFLLGFSVPGLAQGGFADLILDNFIIGGFKIIAGVLNFFAGIVLSMAGFLADAMLNLNLEVLSSKNTLVHVGWRLVRDIANLGFVIVIIVIAFATILRIQTYGVKSLLWRLIVAAVIVNFSFAIAGIFVDFSHVLTKFFFTKIPGAGGGISVHLADAFGPQRLLIDDESVPPSSEEDSGGLGFGTAALISITGLIFTVVFTLAAALTILALALMLFIRYLYLTFLIILAPIVWLFWVIPNLKGQFDKWWKRFIEWVFFAPASAFFVYLALISAEALGTERLEGAASSVFGVGSLLKNLVIQGAQMIVLAGILIAGLIAAQKLSINFAENSVNATKAGSFGLTKWMGRQGVRGATLPLRRPGVQNRLQSWTTQGAQRAATGNALQRAGGRIQSFVGTGLYGLSQAGATTPTNTLFQSTIGAVKEGWKRKKKKQKITPEQAAAGEIEIPEEENEESGTTGAGPRRTPRAGPRFDETTGETTVNL